MNENALPVSLTIVFELKKKTFMKYHCEYSFFFIIPNAPELTFIQILFLKFTHCVCSL